MSIIIMHDTISDSDRIGYDIIKTHRLLSRKHKCVVYSEDRDGQDLSRVDRSEVEKALENPKNAVIYYHSGYWEDGFELLRCARGRTIIRYSGIAPERLFDGYDDEAYYRALLGCDQTREIQALCPDAYWLCTSSRVSRDLKDIPRYRIGICPPFTSVEERFDGIMPDEAALRRLIENTTCHLLFSGPISPESGLLTLLDILIAYRDLYNSDITLHIMRESGSVNRAYSDFFQRRIMEYGLQWNVQFVPRLDLNEEVSYYLGCDMMLQSGEYDCNVRVIALAQYFKLPILAVNTSSAPETMGLNQLSFDADPRRFAAAIHTLRQDGKLARSLGRIGKKNFDARLSAQGVSDKLSTELEKGLWEV